jgi:DNA-directed RNA polymerase
MTLLTQLEVEKQMYAGGIARAERSMQKAEDGGRAHQNPYAKAIFRDYVMPLAEAIKASIATAASRPGASAAHVLLLKPLDPEAVAFLAVRQIVVAVCSGNGILNHRRLGYVIGKAVHSELVLAQIEHAAPELYYTLVRDLGLRLSKDERHRMTVFKLQAQQRGIEWVEWNIGARDQVGLYLLGLASALGLVEIEPETRGKGHERAPRHVSLSPEVQEQVNSIKDFVALNAPAYGPCVEPPIDWKNGDGGGFHTHQLRMANPKLIRCHSSARPWAHGKSMPIVDAAANALQRTAWRINQRVLRAVKEYAQVGSTEEIVTMADAPKPVQPAWLQPDTDKKALSEEQAKEFKGWKRRMADWYTERKLRGAKFNRLSSALRMADAFKDQPALHFVYFADSRGRLYPMTTGISPQGSDMQKALLEFAEGKPVTTPEAIRWFHVQGANKWGFDKATLAERHAWVIERQDLICSFADDPVNNPGWTEADCPLQFLAWCFEYRDWVRDSDGSFVSHLPISMDGSCNGLQNLSAMFRDEVGGKATNLTRNVHMEDIYRRVAEAATVRISEACYADDPVRESLRKRWVQHGIARAVVKRTVMCTPYGVTKSSATDYVIDDYLKTKAAPCFAPDEYHAAARVLMESVWPAVGDVIVKGAQAMSWLKKGARVIVKGLDDDTASITWTSPSGFPASQAYFEENVHRIRTRLFGEEKIRVLSESEDPSPNKHSNGLAPNFVHSMDAAHLHRTAARAAAEGINALAMIHDDYGTHAADSERLFHIIRQEFVDMYEEHDPVAEFVARYPAIAAPPERGLLNIREVLESPYFFS